MRKKCWICISLNKRQICFLDEISKGCRFSGGRKMCRTSILRALLKAVRKLDIDVTSVKSEEELKNRVIEAFCKHK